MRLPWLQVLDCEVLSLSKMRFSGFLTAFKHKDCFLYHSTEAAEIVRSISLAVAHLHHMNVAHRDLKVRMHAHPCMEYKMMCSIPLCPEHSSEVNTQLASTYTCTTVLSYQRLCCICVSILVKVFFLYVYNGSVEFLTL